MGDDVLIFKNTGISKIESDISELVMHLKKNEHQSLKLLRCQFDYYALVDEEMALKFLKKIELKKMAMTEGDIISHLVCEFMFFVKCEDFERCERTINEMKKYRKFNLTENFNFMKKLLDHLNKNAPIYMYGDDFKSVPVLYLQLKVIHSFDENNIPKCQRILESVACTLSRNISIRLQLRRSKMSFLSMY